ncbi:MFS transporter [Actinokineospora sp. G85]|uniref:MFS transporter n=1 Tax=Actinokineospora sp. G85 TaxID=3406626 RepID=UPI003C77C6DF
MNGQGTASPQARAGTRQWLGLIFLLLPTMLLTIDLGVLWLATPSLAADLGPTSTQLLWINDIYGFVIATLLVLMGNVGDRVGHRRLVMLGALVFTAASLVAAFAPNPETLIAARALLGLAGATIIPCTLALISNMFADPGQRSRAIALWVSALSAGVAIGPVISGVMLQSFWWGSVFLIGVPVMIGTLVVTPLAVPETSNPTARSLDKVSVPLLLLTLLPLVYAIKRIGEHGVDPLMVVSLAVAVVFGVLFTRRQRTLEDPLLALSLFGDRTFSAALLLLFVGLAAMNGVGYLVPQYLQLVADLPSVTAGLLMVLPAVGLIIGSQLTPVVAKSVRPAYVVAGGALIAAAAFTLMANVPGDSSGVLPTMAGGFLMMFGLAPITVLGTAIAVGAAPAERAGQASSVGQTAYELGLAFGIAATGSVVAAVYRAEVTAGAPEAAPDAAVGEIANNLSGGLALAERLAGEVGSTMTSVVRGAFTSGFHTAAAVSAVLCVVFLGLAVTLLKGVPATGAAAEPAEEAGHVPVEPADDAHPSTVSH